MLFLLNWELVFRRFFLLNDIFLKFSFFVRWRFFCRFRLGLVNELCELFFWLVFFIVYIFFELVLVCVYFRLYSLLVRIMLFFIFFLSFVFLNDRRRRSWCFKLLFIGVFFFIIVVSGVGIACIFFMRFFLLLGFFFSFSLLLNIFFGFLLWIFGFGIFFIIFFLRLYFGMCFGFGRGLNIFVNDREIIN